MNKAVFPLRGGAMIEDEDEKSQTPKPVCPTSYEETEVMVRHRYFEPDGTRVPEEKLRAIEEAWKGSGKSIRNTPFQRDKSSVRK